METNQDVTFNEDSSYNNSRQFHLEETKETKVPRTRDTIMKDVIQEDHDLIEPHRPIDTPREQGSYK